MRWRDSRRSSNVEDRRATRISGFGGQGGGMLRLLPLAFRFLGFKGTAILVLGFAAYALFTGNLASLLAVLGMQPAGPTGADNTPVQESAQEQELVDFVSAILGDTEETWHELFKAPRQTI